MTVHGRILESTFWLVLIAGLTACGGPSTIKIKGNISASEDVNPDASGQASPIVLMIYQLRSPGPFMKSSYFELAENANATLGQNLIKSEEFELEPGQNYEYNTKFDAETKYAGVIAAYQDWENARWRELVSIPDKRKAYLYIDLEKLTVLVSTDKR